MTSVRRDLSDVVNLCVGTGMASRKIANRGIPGWQQSAEDVAFFERHPELLNAEVK